MVFVLIAATGCTDCASLTASHLHRKECKLIDAYSDQLWHAIKTHNVDAFIALRHSKGDLPANINTGASILLLSDDRDIPSARAELEGQFTDLISGLEVKVGRLSDASCTRVAHVISEAPLALKLGLFDFSVTLKIEAHGKIAYLSQSSNFLTVHGVRWGTVPELTDDPGPN
jgi:hypothetical protein